MIRVIKGNKEICIEDSELQTYTAQGFSVIDEKGNIVQLGRATTIDEIVAENKLLKKENARLKAKLGELEVLLSEGSAEVKDKEDTLNAEYSRQETAVDRDEGKSEAKARKGSKAKA